MLYFGEIPFLLAGHKTYGSGTGTSAESSGGSATRLRTKMMRLRPGDHACSFYDHPNDQNDVITSFLRVGLARGERCICVVDDRTSDDVIHQLEKGKVNVEREIEEGALIFFTREDWRVRDAFCIESMAEHVKSVLDNAGTQKWPGLWVAVEMTWALDPDAEADMLGQWESAGNTFLQGMPSVLLCQYNRRRIPPAAIYHAVKTHPIIITSNDVYRNFYYEPPDIYSDNDSYKQKADWMLQQFPRARAIEEERAHRLREQAVRTQAEESEKRTKDILESITDGFVAVNREWRFTYINRHATQVIRKFQKEPEQLMGKILWDHLSDLVGTVFDEQCHIAMAQEIPVHFEVYQAEADVWFEIHAYPSSDGLAIYIRDITKRKQIESRLQQSLKEKEVLLQEVHHRVKNNLQVVASLLELQSREINDPHLRALFKEGQSRVRAMALIHERLSRSDNLGEIDMAPYIRDLVSELVYSYGVDRSKILIQVEAKGGSLPLNTAMACALILQELTSNCFKYAFPGGQSGVVKIMLDTEGESGVLQVCDNGVGLPPRLTPENATSLGLRLVKLLTRQIAGTIELIPMSAACFRVSFPLQRPG